MCVRRSSVLIFEVSDSHEFPEHAKLVEILHVFSVSYGTEDLVMVFLN